MSGPTDAARAKLRQSQGAGARYDAASAPHDALLLARRGTAFFARKLMELSDADLYLPSAIQGCTRARLVAEVSLSARRQAMVLEALAKRAPTELPPDLERPLSDLDLAETLPPHAIRHLFRHTEAHLNVCWRDLTDAQWDMPITLPNAAAITPRRLPRHRAVQVWRTALDLGTGATTRDAPPELRDDLLGS